MNSILQSGAACHWLGFEEENMRSSNSWWAATAQAGHGNYPFLIVKTLGMTGFPVLNLKRAKSTKEKLIKSQDHISYLEHLLVTLVTCQAWFWPLCIDNVTNLTKPLGSCNTPQIVYKVAICPRGNLPYIQIIFIVIPYSKSINYLAGSW